MQYAAWTMLAYMLDRREREAQQCHHRAIREQFKLANGEEVAHASLQLIEKLDEREGRIDWLCYLGHDVKSWKANCDLVLTCVAKQ